jgi:23S rRNA G2445 N2-methylase RlmL
MKRIKRQVYGKLHQARILPPPGFSEICRREIEDLRKILTRKPDTFTASAKRNILLSNVDYRALLETTARSVTASEIKLIAGEGIARYPKDLEKVFSHVPWELYLPAGSAVTCKTDSVASNVFHEGLIRERLEDFLSRQEYRPGPKGFKIKTAIFHDKAQIQIDLSGEPLWKRNYRTSFSATAPLREDIAQCAVHCSMLNQSDKIDTIFLLVPFAGSGTLLFESIIYFYQLPNFLFGRDYAFMHFTSHPKESFSWMKTQVLNRITEDSRPYLDAALIDTDFNALNDLKHNLDAFRQKLNRNGIQSPKIPEMLQMDAMKADWYDFIPQGTEMVFLPLNPPYGRRLKEGKYQDIYTMTGKRISELHKYLRSNRIKLCGFIICPNEKKWLTVKHSLQELHTETSHFTQGGMDMRLLTFS